MIRHIVRKKINLNKYDDCINNAIQNSSYANSSFLDIVCDDWDLLVLNDYEAVMPLPKRKKYFINYIYTPFLIQQLGILSPTEVKSSLINEFIKSIPNKFKLVNFNFNSTNKFSAEGVHTKKNYILNLNRSYQELYNNYRRDRKSRLKQVKEKDLSIQKCDPQLIARSFMKDKGSVLSFKPSDSEKTILLMMYCLDHNNGMAYGVFDKTDDTFLGGSIFYKAANRIIYLISTTPSIGKKLNTPTLLLDHVIKLNSETEYKLDFAGSMVPGIASFFKSFGATTEDYASFHKETSIKKLLTLKNRL